MTYSREELGAVCNPDFPTHKYALEIVEGKRVAGIWERLSCERHLKDLLRQNTDGFPYVFDETRADRIFRWFGVACVHVRGVFTGKNINLLPFQKYDYGCVFGWVRADSGRRRFTHAFNEIARGHAKSTGQSGIATYGLCGDCYYPPGQPEKRIFEITPHIECAAYDKEQAKIVWEDARKMASESPRIREQVEVGRGYIRHKDRGGHINPLSKELKNKTGLAPSIAIIDEFHEWKSYSIYGKIESSLGKRAQSLINIITTAGEDATNSPCKQEEEFCKKILSGEVVDEKYFVNIRQLDKGDNPHDRSVWPKANPMLSEDNEYTRILREEIESEYNKAYASGLISKINEFLTMRMNMWQAESEKKFMSGCMDQYRALGIPREEFCELVRGRKCYNGLDLSRTIDLTGSGYVFNLDDGRVAVTAHGFIPENRVKQHEHSDRVEYRAWAKQGWCTLTPGLTVDYKLVLEHIHKMEAEQGWQMAEICYDPKSAEYPTQDLERDGYTRVEIRQMMSDLSEPTKWFRTLVLEGKLVHDGSPLLEWCVSNAMEISDTNENIKLSKKNKDDTQRIDLLAAVINALVRAMANAHKPEPEELTEERIEAFYREGSGQED